MATIVENITTIKNSIDRMKEALNLPSNTPLEDLTLAVEDGGSSAEKSNIYKVKTIAERDVITDMVEEDICVVLGENEKVAITDASQKFKEISFPSTITSTRMAAVNFEYVGVISGNTLLKCSKNMMSTTLTITIDTPIYSGTLTYTGTSSGTAYSLGNTTGNVDANMIIDLGETVKCTTGSLTTYMKNVLKETYKPTIFGIYKFVGGTWVNATIGVGVDASDVSDDVEVFTNDGLLLGTFPDNTTNSIIKLNNALGKFKSETGKPTTLEGVYQNNTSLISFELGAFMDVSQCTSFKSMFSGASNLTSASVENWDMSNAQDISYMFWFCEALTNIDVSNWDVSNVQNLSGAFYGTGLRTIDVTNWNVSACTKIGSMFGGNDYLEEVIGLTTWQTPNNTDLSSFMTGCDALIEADLSSFNTDKVTTFSYMFQNDIALKRIDMKNATLNSCINTTSMFSGCTSLEFLDIRNFEFTSTLTDYSYMFADIPADCLIIVKDSAARNWIKTQRSDFTNIKTVSEYEG